MAGYDPFGSKPKVATYHRVKLQPTLADLVSANTENFPEISHLADLYSTEELNQLDKIIPDYSQRLAQGAETTGQLFDVSQSLLRGEVPQDVQDFVRRQAAQESAGGGFVFDPRSIYLRDIAKTSYDALGLGSQLAGQGASTMQIWDTLARRDMLDPGSMFATPGQAEQLALENEVNKYNQKQYRYNVAAQPDPFSKGIHDTVLTLVSAYLGSMGGGALKGGMGGSTGSSVFNQGASGYTGDWATNARGYG